MSARRDRPLLRRCGAPREVGVGSRLSSRPCRRPSPREAAARACSWGRGLRKRHWRGGMRRHSETFGGLRSGAEECGSLRKLAEACEGAQGRAEARGGAWGRVEARGGVWRRARACGGVWRLRGRAEGARTRLEAC